MAEGRPQVVGFRPRRFRRYPDYKDTGVEWLGDVPAHWKVRRLKDQGALVGGAGFPHDYQGISDEVLPFYKVGDLSASSDGRHMRSAPNTVSPEIARELRAHVIPANSIVYAKIGAALLLNRRRVTTRLCCIDNNMSAYVPCDELTTEWAFHCTATVDFAAFAHPGAVPSLSEGDQADIPIVIPSLPEQHAITDFLDRETAKTDALVAKKERLIELLQEKRSALITRAVTRGLDPNVAMKDSGVEWLGEIPAHWDGARLRRLCAAISGATPARENPAYWNGEIPWVSPKDMKRRVVATSEELITQRAIDETGIRLITPPVVLVVVRGMILAHSFPVAETTVPITINQDMKALRPVEGVHPSYFAWALDGLARGILATVVDEAAHGTRVIRMDQWRNVICPVPTYSEQNDIACFLESETNRIDALITKIRQAIDHLTEYRTALISAAVTGKIDVRNEAA